MKSQWVLPAVIIFTLLVFLLQEPGVAFFMVIVLLPFVLVQFVIQEDYVRATRRCLERYARLVRSAIR